ncbi:U32 family peptidase [Trichocoleus sp. FACHB-262]|uniref:U32 family peptidase n=1 Tax=Trichocoleus sp. FACHB-262 TaxID=2692869 RepID=UPI001683332D|nr:U32 family peptidase [Trichocoleus sp. FACHB-262]MBD2120668.1 U32 family peptidase [Trichocoleus sp. FACHB-262]
MNIAHPAPDSSLSTFHRPELLAPAGNWDCAKAAVENGADAIYFGLDRFNARMRAQNFTEADLPKLMEFLHRRGVKGYVTLNTLIFPNELTEAEQYLRTIIAAGVDAAIVQDVGICRLIRHLSPDFPIHASTQMTVTSAAGVEFAKDLGCHLVVLARECSLKEINKIQAQIAEQEVALPLEVFVHGALCVAYSGQCLTSESLGGRSANRGECAQACRMTYELIADGQTVDLGDRKYLLSPQDLAGLDVLPELVKTGVTSLKIEGRLKAPEYVANVTRVYREALDRVMAGLGEPNPLAPFPRREGGSREPRQTERQVEQGDQDHYNLEMAFSRGLSTGWFRGIDNQELVHARFGKKRGVYLGEITRIRQDQITVRLEAPVKPGDGIVFDSGHPEAKEEGGRIYTVDLRGPEATLTFGREALNLRRIHVGDRVWKTNDPELDREIRQTYSGEHPQFQRPIQLEVHGEVGQPLVAIARDGLGHVVQVESTMSLVEAHNKPLTIERLQEQLGRLGNTPFELGTLTNHITGNVMLPVSELNRLRREMVVQLEELRAQPKRWQLRSPASWQELLSQPLSTLKAQANSQVQTPELVVLVRNLKQLQAALAAGIQTLYCEFEDPRAYRDAVQMVRKKNEKAFSSLPSIYVAPPRITKAGENWILQQVKACDADGYLVRNYDQLQFFGGDRCIGDFSLNVANPLTAGYFKQRYGLERLTASYDLNMAQLEALLTSCPADWFEVTVHQHMPMFHMEHCVFCAFLSEGTDYTNCGRPCEEHEVTLRDRVGAEHILQADAGCRNTVFNGTAQTGAEYVQHLLKLGVRHFRIEFVNEAPEQVAQTIQRYQQLLQGEITGAQLWRELRLQNQLGVTRGPLETRS